MRHQYPSDIKVPKTPWGALRALARDIEAMETCSPGTMAFLRRVLERKIVKVTVPYTEWIPFTFEPDPFDSWKFHLRLSPGGCWLVQRFSIENPPCDSLFDGDWERKRPMSKSAVRLSCLLYCFENAARMDFAPIFRWYSNERQFPVTRKYDPVSEGMIHRLSQRVPALLRSKPSLPDALRRVASYAQRGFPLDEEI